MKELEDNEKVTGLPENAYRELKEGETYHPVMSPQKQYKEVTPWSVCWGLVMAVIFSAAAAYLGLKVGQVFEAAIPIAIIAVGLSNGFKRKNALGENVIIQSIGANSGVIVAGAIFTLPALYILSGNICKFLPSILKFPARRNIRYPVTYTVPQIFCFGHAREIPVPGSNSHHTGSGVRRKRRKTSEAPYHSRNRRRFI